MRVKKRAHENKKYPVKGTDEGSGRPPPREGPVKVGCKTVEREGLCDEGYKYARHCCFYTHTHTHTLSCVPMMYVYYDTRFKRVARVAPTPRPRRRVQVVFSKVQKDVLLRPTR